MPITLRLILNYSHFSNNIKTTNSDYLQNNFNNEKKYNVDNYYPF